MTHRKEELTISNDHAEVYLVNGGVADRFINACREVYNDTLAELAKGSK